jgi:hypothetical protein
MRTVGPASLPRPRSSPRARLARLWPALALALLAACGQRDTDPGPGGVSVGEARALDEAASMLDQQRLPPAALSQDTSTPQPSPSPTPASSPSPNPSPAA